MGQPYVGEIRMFGGNFAPAGWFFCNGQLLPISENDVLFALIGTTYGGDGQNTFAVPNLQSRVPMHMGNATGSTSARVIGETGGVENVMLTLNQIPSHTHQLVATTANATTPTPSGAVMLASNAGIKLYTPRAATVATGMGTAQAGSSQAHSNVMPYQTVSFIISLFGIFPSPN